MSMIPVMTGVKTLELSNLCDCGATLTVSCRILCAARRELDDVTCRYYWGNLEARFE